MIRGWLPVAADYVFRDRTDQRRVRLFRRDEGWDFDVFEREPRAVWNYTSKMAESPFLTRREAKQVALDLVGPLTSIQPRTVTEGW